MTDRIARTSIRPSSRLAVPLMLSSALVLAGCSAQTSPEQTETQASPAAAPSGSSGESTSPDASSETTPRESAAPAPERPAFPASNTTGLLPLATVEEGNITPKSVVSNDHGLMITNNMMYSHNVTLYDVHNREPVVELSDTVDADEYELEGLSGQVSGSPVEAVWTQDGRYAYVSQYLVDGHGATAEDNCTNGQAITPSMVYRYNAEQEDWDQVIRVGRVP